MKVLAIDTATERCSVALLVKGSVIQRSVETARGHADLILPMVQEVLAEAGVPLTALDGIAYGRGPGAFTGVRIAIGVVQGLAYGANLKTVGISNLAAVAQQVAAPSARVLVCMDARMSEVYWGEFGCDPETGLVAATSGEAVGPPDSVQPITLPTILAGTGFKAYPQLAAGFDDLSAHDLLPHAAAIARLGEARLQAGDGVPAWQAQPVYLRNNVAVAKK